jgi:hypothetical protein
MELFQRDLNGCSTSMTYEAPILISLMSIVLRSGRKSVIGAATMKSISPSGNVSLR